MTKQRTKSHHPRGPDDDRLVELALELDRLDALQATHWSRAMKGDVAAAEAYLELVDRKILLLADDRAGARH
jgi:hypothetical protein